MDTSLTWWTRTAHEDRRGLLLARNRLKVALRSWFEQQGFVEVETAALQVSPGNEAHLHAFRTEVADPDGTRRTLYLHTSPEFACKKLLAAGEERIFTFAPVFRNRERGRLHHPEFMMLEWYRSRAPYEHLMQDCADILRLAGGATGLGTWSFKGIEMASDAPVKRISVRDAFREHARIDLDAALGDGIADRERLAAMARAAGLRVAPDDTWSDIFSRIVTAIEPRLGAGAPVILERYPSIEATLARPCSDDARYAERFELYACGVELANGFGELTDAGEQRARFQAEMAEKQRVHGECYPIDEDFLAALAHMPPASGIALGFDRLVMLATGAQSIDRVIWTPVTERTT